MGRGDYFGEVALLGDAPRSATVTATEPTTCMRLDRTTFNQLFGPLRDVLRRGYSDLPPLPSTDGPPPPPRAPPPVRSWSTSEMLGGGSSASPGIKHFRLAGARRTEGELLVNRVEVLLLTHEPSVSHTTLLASLYNEA